jgi:hypothetical protein
MLFGLALACVLGTAMVAYAGSSDNSTSARLIFVAEYKAPGLEMELSGIHPHPTDDNLYFVLANNTPVYQTSQSPMLPAQYRGKLLTVNRHTGRIVKAFNLVNGEYGGLAYGDNHLFVASLEPAEILQVDPMIGSRRKGIFEIAWVPGRDAY